MLPFLKNRDAASASTPVETLERDPDEGAEPDMLDAVFDDLLAAIESKDKKLGRSALEALVMHIQMSDLDQDAEMAP